MYRSRHIPPSWDKPGPPKNTFGTGSAFIGSDLGIENMDPRACINYEWNMYTIRPLRDLIFIMFLRTLILRLALPRFLTEVTNIVNTCTLCPQSLVLKYRITMRKRLLEHRTKQHLKKTRTNCPWTALVTKRKKERDREKQKERIPFMLFSAKLYF